MVKKTIAVMMTVLMLSTALAGCGRKTSVPAGPLPVGSAPPAASAEPSAAQEPVMPELSEEEAAANQLLLDMAGSYRELWPVILSDEYRELWLADSVPFVGEENAEAAVELLASMVTGALTGEAAVNAYTDGSMAYCCDFFAGRTDALLRRQYDPRL